jgi:cobalt-zinc-cadmium efflux system protein
MHQKSSHNHSHGDKTVNSKNLLWVTLLNLLITAAELIGGILSNSLSLLSDALHNLSDSFASFIAWIAIRLSSKNSTPKATFGLKRIEILAALFNAVTLIVLIIYLFREAWFRLQNPEPVNSVVMLMVATVGLLANIYAVILLKKDSAKNLNIKAAYIHLIGDSLSSAVVILGGFLMLYFEIYWIDPLITFLIGLYILKETFEILKETVNILMQHTPECLDLHEIKREIEKIEEVNNIHHIHAWNLTDQLIHFEAHVDIKEDLHLSQVEKVRAQIENILKNSFNIDHITLQFEYKTTDHKSMIFNRE